ncbi:MAG TPA: hypothetical protein DEQ14_05085 [Treponema sp.]|nr:hypothetical protein [Treponema sp.]
MRKIISLLVIFVMTYSISAEDSYPSENESPEVIHLLLEAGYDINDHPNYMLYKSPWEELIRLDAPLPFFEKMLVLGKNIEPDFANGINESPLVMAIQKNNYEVVDFLIKSGANVNRLHRRQRTPIYHAARDADFRILELLIKAGADVNRTDEGGYTPLHTVFSQFGERNHKEKIEVLLANQANINAVTSDGLTPLMQSVSTFMSQAEVVQTLLSGRPNINAVNSEGQSALIIAAANVDDPAIISLLLNAGADARLEDNTGRTALDWFDLNKRINRSPVRMELF